MIDVPPTRLGLTDHSLQVSCMLRAFATAVPRPITCRAKPRHALGQDQTGISPQCGSLFACEAAAAAIAAPKTGTLVHLGGSVDRYSITPKIFLLTYCGHKLKCEMVITF